MFTHRFGRPPCWKMHEHVLMYQASPRDYDNSQSAIISISPFHVSTLSDIPRAGYDVTTLLPSSGPLFLHPLNLITEVGTVNHLSRTLSKRFISDAPERKITYLTVKKITSRKGYCDDNGEGVASITYHGYAMREVSVNYTSLYGTI